MNFDNIKVGNRIPDEARMPEFLKTSFRILIPAKIAHNIWQDFMYYDTLSAAESYLTNVNPKLRPAVILYKMKVLRVFQK